MAALLLCLMLSACRQQGDAGDAAQRAPASAVATRPSPGPRVETRSLLSAIDQAKFGATARVRTAFATGSGLVLPATHEVLAHLHVILAPDRSMAGAIFVDLRTSPRHAERNLSAYVIAQDPTHDLVLLQVGAPAAGAATNPQPIAAQTMTAIKEPTAPVTTRPSIRSAAVPVSPETALAPAPTAANGQDQKVKLQVIYDGPAAGTGEAANTPQ